MNIIQKLHLRDLHILNSAKLTEFAGWEMPVSYGSAVDEHLHTRSQSSLFDVSHMGEIRVLGRDAGEFLEFVLTNTVKNINSGRAIYSPFCFEDGGTVDDLIVYKKSDVDYLLCVNASNIEKDYNHFIQYSSTFDCEIINESNLFGQLALQGPLSEKILSSVINQDLSCISKMCFIEQEFSIGHALISRTGYSGEDGFEIYCPLKDLENWAIALSQHESSGDCRWAGLAARDSLRLEAGFPLYGHELSSSITPVQAGLNWAIKWEKTDFVGRQKLLIESKSGAAGRVRFYEVEDRRIPRDGSKILLDGKEYGVVLSGGYSPSIKKPIGSAWIQSKGLEHINKLGWKAEVRSTSVDLFFAPPVLRRK